MSIIDQLGMPLGTACHRLRQQLMYMLVCETDRDTCHVCRQPIASVEELSIEHIKPWLHRDPALFWDLDNIAFSHRACNRPHDNSGPIPARICSPGHAWCRHHQCEHPIAEFSMRTANGKRKPRVDCKVARAERKRLGLPH